MFPLYAERKGININQHKKKPKCIKNIQHLQASHSGKGFPGGKEFPGKSQRNLDPKLGESTHHNFQ